MNTILDNYSLKRYDAKYQIYRDIDKDEERMAKEKGFISPVNFYHYMPKTFFIAVITKEQTIIYYKATLNK